MTDEADAGQVAETSVNAQGRVTIPAQIRRNAGVGPGSALVVYLEDGRIVLETREQLAARVQREVGEAWTGTGDVAEELLADRRIEGRRADDA